MVKWLPYPPIYEDIMSKLGWERQEVSVGIQADWKFVEGGLLLAVEPGERKGQVRVVLLSPTGKELARVELAGKVSGLH